MIGLLKKADAVRAAIGAPLEKFFTGRIYPIVLAALVVIGHVSGFEFYFNFPVMLCAYLSLLFCKSIRGFLPVLLTILYQINYTHAFSDYYFTGPVFVILVSQVVLLGICFIFFFARNVLPMISPRSPLFYPLAALCLAFLLGGAFSGEWIIKNLFYALLQILAYAVIFYTVYYSAVKEDREQLLSYLTYLAAVVAAVIAAELIALYAFGGVIVDGEIVKENVHLGWGMWNPIGFSLTVLIPLIMRGAMVEKHRTVYLIAGICTWICAILSMSRNAQLFSTLAMAACVIIGAFCGKRKTLFRILLGIGITGVAAICILFYDKLIPLAEKFLYDNGRFDLWRTAVENFLEAPIFGKGFYGFGMGNVFASFLPWLAHNTVLEFMSATGIVGTLAYLYYRISTAIPFIRRMSYDRLMLALPILITLGMSMIDNYVFHVYTTFVYSICLAVAFGLNDAGEERVKI